MTKKIRFVTDYVCPYCLVAKVPLLEAIKDMDVEIEWLPFELTPEPKERIDTYNDKQRHEKWANSLKPYADALNIPMKLPPKVFYPLVRLGGKIFGGFDIEETSAVEEVQKTTLPVIILHGTDDDKVPYYMSKKIYDACAGRKVLVTFEGAGHGTSCMVDFKKYLDALSDFESNYLSL